MTDDLIRQRLTRLPLERLTEELVDLGNRDPVVRDRPDLLAAEHDPAALAEVLRKRIASLGNQGDFVSYGHSFAYAHELDHIVTTKLAAVAGRRIVEVICYRHLIRDILGEARSKAYGHAVKYYRTLETLDRQVGEYGPLGDHASFVAEIRKQHGRKYGFWGRLEPEKPR